MEEQKKSVEGLEEKKIENVDFESRPIAKLEESNPKVEKKKYDVHSLLNRLYSPETQQDNDFSKIHPRGQGWWKYVLLFLLGLFLILATLVISFVWFSSQGDQKFGDEQIVLSIQGPVQASSGQQVVYQIIYTNQSAGMLKNATLQIQTAPDFSITQISPDFYVTDQMPWSLGDIPAGKQMTVSVEGKYIGLQAEQKTFSAILEFLPEKLNTRIKKYASLDTLIDTSPIQLEVSGRGQAKPGDTLIYEVTYRNLTKESLKDLRIHMQPPADVMITSTQPSADAQGNWILDTLEPETERTIKIQGKVSEKASGLKKMEVWLEKKEGDTYTTIQKGEYKTQISSLSSQFRLSLNGQEQSSFIPWNNTATLTLQFTPQETMVLENAVLTVQIPSLLINTEKKSLMTNPEIGEKKLIWTSEQIPALQYISSSHPLSVDIKVPFTSLDTVKGSLSSVSSEGKILIDAQLEESSSVLVSQPLTLLVQGSAGISLSGHYYDEGGTKVGSGPLPPKVGQTTTYRIYLDGIFDTSYTQLQISTSLPTGVVFTGVSSISLGEWYFDKKTKELVWQLKSVSEKLPITGYFDVQVTPTTADKGKALLLVSAGKFTAIDSSKKVVSQSLPAITTQLLYDGFAKDDGFVTE